jgi:RecB family exonuclease
MSPRPATLVVHPDSARVELALLEDSRATGFVDAGRRRSFAQLLDACQGPAHAGLAPASPWLVRALFATEAPASAQAAFGAVASTPDFAMQAFALRGELFSQDVTPAFFADVASRVGGRVGEKVTALASLFERVDARLSELHQVDARGLVGLATRRLKEAGLPESLERFGGLEVRDLHDLPPARLSFLDALARAAIARGLTFRLVLPWAGSPHTDAFVGGVARFFERRWEALPGAELVPESAPGERAVALRGVFAAEASVSPADGLSLVSCASPRDEARAIASGVRRLLDEGLPPERVAVAFRDLADDTELLVEQLELLGVPARARLGLPLARSPIGRLALSLLRLADDGFPVDDVSALLESRYARAWSKHLPPCRAAFAEAGIRNDVIGASDGEGAWRVRLGGLLERKRRLAADRRSMQAEVIELYRLEQGVQQVLALGRSIPARATAGELLKAFTKALASLGIDEALREPEPALQGDVFDQEIDRALARDQASFEALTGLLTALREGFERSGFAAIRLERRTFARWLSLAAQDVNLQARGPRTGAVWLVDARELPGMRFDAVFLGGLIDGRFPGRPSPAPLLSDDERLALNGAAPSPVFRVSVIDDGVALPLRLAEDRLLFHAALTSAPRVTVTAPRVDARGREALRSPFLDALGRVFQPLPVQTRAHRPVPLLEDVECEADLAARAALECFSAAETRQSPRSTLAPALETVLSQAKWMPGARLAASMETERLRYFSDAERPVGAFSGRVDGDVLSRLQPALEWGLSRPVSASQLEGWSRCHFLGLSRRILKLEEDEEAGEEMDSRALGELMHLTLRRLIPKLQQRRQWAPAPAARELVANELDACLVEAADEVRRTLPVGHVLLFALTVERARRELLQLVYEQAVAPIIGAEPASFEQPFGRKDAPEAVQQVSIPPALPGERPLFLTGAIDRIDLAPGQVGVVDYKLSRTGNPKARLDALLLQDFQLPLYLYVARQQYPGRALDAAWVGLRKREALVLSRVLRDEDYGIDDVLAVDLETRRRLAHAEVPNLANSVHALNTSLRAGDFGARPLDCKYCHLRSVCRISARRLLDEREAD